MRDERVSRVSRRHLGYQYQSISSETTPLSFSDYSKAMIAYYTVQKHPKLQRYQHLATLSSKNLNEIQQSAMLITPFPTPYITTQQPPSSLLGFYQND